MELLPCCEPPLHLGYKIQSVIAAYGNNRCLFSDPHTKHEYTVWAERRISEYSAWWYIQ